MKLCIDNILRIEKEYKELFNHVCQSPKNEKELIDIKNSIKDLDNDFFKKEQSI